MYGTFKIIKYKLKKIKISVICILNNIKKKIYCILIYNIMKMNELVNKWFFSSNKNIYMLIFFYEN